MADAGRPCLCSSGRSFATCCGPYLQADKLPQTAEQLMRSRYSAFVVGDSDYLRQTWHETTRPEQLQVEQGVHWLGLQILACQAGGPEDVEGWVEFMAQFKVHGRLQCLHERSRFRRKEGRWYYLDGQIHQQPKAEKVGRNTSCPCGSGKKFKRCCG